MQNYAQTISIAALMAIGAALPGCFSSTREVDTVPATVVQAPPQVVADSASCRSAAADCRGRADEPNEYYYLG